MNTTDTVQFEHLKRWERPRNYAGATWEGWYAFLGQSRDSDCLEQSNFATGLAAVKAVASKDGVPGDEDESATVQVVREGHWAVGWVEWIAIHVSDVAALNEAERLLARRDRYPALDEQDWFDRETEAANTVWHDCYRAGERVEYIRKHRSQFDFRDFADLMACARGKYFAGYASELLN